MNRTPTGSEVAAAHAKGKISWPGVELRLSWFASRASDLHVSARSLEDWGSDFYLACAAALDEASAIAIIDQEYIARLAPRIRRLGASVDDISDVLQAVRERLFTGERPRIRAYDAGGPLAQWIKVVAIRAAVDRHRVEARVHRTLGEPSNDTLRGHPDPADAMFKSRYRTEFAAVLRSAIASLPERDRVVLRMHLIEGQSLEVIGAARGVHRVTVARWVWSAGEILLEALRRHFNGRYGMVPSECESLAHLVQSQLSLDLPALLLGAG